MKSSLFQSNRHLIKSGGESNHIGVDEIYTPWSRWSKCRRKCKQIRKRMCAMPEICGKNILKEERPCKRCSRRKKSNFRIVKRIKLSRRAKGLLRLNRAFYSKWTRWSKCSSRTCTTSRER